VMRARGAKWVHTRNTAHDYGIFWGESWVPVAGAKKTAIFIEVVAGHGGHGYVITIKAGEGTAKDRQNAFDAAMRAGEPWDGWKKGKSPGKATHFRLWTLTAIEMTRRCAPCRTSNLSAAPDAPQLPDHDGGNGTLWLPSGVVQLSDAGMTAIGDDAAAAPTSCSAATCRRR
jgi:hypothetical protein